MISVMSAAFVFVGAKSVDNANIFNDSNAENITAYEDGQTNYLSYRLNGDDNNVTFRRNLALKWYAAAGEDTPLVGSENYFSLTIGFDSLNFEAFTVALESSQFSMSKEELTTNEITFTKNASNGLDISVNGEESSVSVAAADIGKIEIAFSDDDTCGNFTVTVNGEDNEVGTFRNIGKYYAQYASASATTPLTPLTFSATGIGEGGAEFNIQSLNGQTFDVDADGNVDDDTAPALVVNSDIRQIFYGTEIDFDTVAIDVCNSSGITTSEYYYYETLGATVDEDNADATLVCGGRTYAELDSDTLLFPEDFADEDTPQVSIAYRVSDGDNSANYLIDWSAQVNANGYIDVLDANDVDDNPTTTFITYENGVLTENTDAIDEYTQAVKKASYKDGDEANGSIQVGEGAYYYIPAFKEYVQDNSCGYTDMEFTVYYRTDSSSTVNTVSGSYDELRIELTAEGRYQFRIVPTNSAGNDMVGVFAYGPNDSNYKEGDITSSNVFEAKNLVTFEFSVQYTGPSIEQPEDDGDVGYVDVTYSVEDFEIIGISDSYSTHYALFYFEQTDNSKVYTAQEIRAAEQADGTNTLGTWRRINEYDSSLDDDDPENHNDYSWNPDSSLSFVPQEQGFYKVQLIVTSDNLGRQTEAKYIEVAANADVIPGETYWLENNVLSLVFLGVGILCLIGIVVILLIKPKNKAAAGAESERKAELKEKREKRK